MNAWIEGLIIAAGVCLVIVRRFQGTPITPRRALVLPVVLGVVGVRDIASVVHGPPAATDLAMMVVTGLVSLAVGVARGRTIRIDRVDGVLLQRYRVVTLGWWVASAAIRMLLRLIADGMHAGVAGNLATLPLMLGITFLGEGLIVLMRSGAWNSGAGGAPAPSDGLGRPRGRGGVGSRRPSERSGRLPRLEQRLGSGLWNRRWESRW